MPQQSISALTGTQAKNEVTAGSPSLPILVAVPAYFGSDLTFGEMMMAVGAFIQVQQALRWFVDTSPTIVNSCATLRRITSIRDVLVTAAEHGTTKNQTDSICTSEDKMIFDNVETTVPTAGIKRCNEMTPNAFCRMSAVLPRIDWVIHVLREAAHYLDVLLASPLPMRRISIGSSAADCVSTDRSSHRNAAANHVSFEHGCRSPRSRPWLVGIAILVLAGCSSPERLPPVPDADTFNAQPLGIPNARFFPTADLERMVAEGRRSIERQRRVFGLASNVPLPTASLLAISGGGDNGAFASGLLVGWTQAGDRPEFQVVTGISSGALAAPFAYLGSDYDGPLHDVYTTITADDVFRERGLIAAIFGNAMADTTPLWQLISKYVDEKLMAGIAREYEKGRLLLIGTTDLDSEQPVLWNIGAIAGSGHPGALDLFRKVLRASSAVPGVFEPVLIDVEVRGKAYQELHVDGGVIAQMFLYPPNIEVGRQLPKYERKAYLIRNGRLDAEWAEVEPRTLSIAKRTVSTLTHYGGANDVLIIYFIAQRDSVDYNLAYIGRDFKALSAGEFDKVYMNALFDYAYQQARKGYSWKKIPPILAGQQN